MDWETLKRANGALWVKWQTMWSTIAGSGVREGVVAASHLSKPQDKHSTARASSAKPAQAREGRSALLCQLLACRAGIPLSPGTIPVPILSYIAVSTNKALCTFHLDLTYREVTHMVVPIRGICQHLFHLVLWPSTLQILARAVRCLINWV